MYQYIFLSTFIEYLNRSKVSPYVNILYKKKNLNWAWNYLWNSEIKIEFRFRQSLKFSFIFCWIKINVKKKKKLSKIQMDVSLHIVIQFLRVFKRVMLLQI